jgi:hypothetical protein
MSLWEKLEPWRNNKTTWRLEEDTSDSENFRYNIVKQDIYVSKRVATDIGQLELNEFLLKNCGDKDTVCHGAQTWTGAELKEKIRKILV